MNLLSKLLPGALLLLSLSLTCCKKSHGRYSKWYVGTDSFSTNGVEVYQGRQIYRLDDDDDVNGFWIGTEYPPHERPYPIYHVTSSNPDSVGFSVTYHSRFYTVTPSNHSYLLASESDGKLVFTLPEGWFVNYQDANDSVLIKGMFCEP